MKGVLNPAILQLVRFQSTAKWRRLLRGFSSPRRFIFSVLATTLAFFWLSNAAMSVLFRESAGVERFRGWVSIGLLIYALWHLVKVVCQRPEEPIEWTEAERELLCGGPFRRHELIIYRLAGIANAALVKAICFTVLMLPDLALFLPGFLGTLLALLFLDAIRMSVEIVASGVSNRTYHRMRNATVVIVAGAVTSALTIAACTPIAWKAGPSSLSLGLVVHVIRAALSLIQTPVGLVAKAPFDVFGQLITATRYDLATVVFFGLATAMVGTSLWLIIRLDRHFQTVTTARERAGYPPSVAHRETEKARMRAASLPRVARLAGVGPVAWRQLIGAIHQRGSLLFALALPGLLACLPIVVRQDGKKAALNVAAALIFYTFLLLPAALKFDFRRDIQRMIVFKMLPIRPIAIAVGQVTAPVLLAFGFQIVVLTVTYFARPFPLWMMFAILTLMLPLNVLIFALDNLVYLLYPYRLNQEGIEIFLRTTLTFTAKGIILTVGLVIAFAWSFVANFLSRELLGSVDEAATVFVVGGGIMLWGASAMALAALSRAFVRFDPSQDTPA